MNKQLLFLSVVCFLCTNVFGQYFIYYTEMTGDQMTPPVNSQRTATLTLSFLPGVGGVTVLYSFLDNSIVDKTVLSLYAPTPSDPAALLVDKPNPTQNGQAIIPLAGSENNYTVIINYINSINALFSLGYAHAILRTSAFPNGELRGDFSGVNYRRDQFYGATVFPFPQTLVERHVVFISCEGVLNSGTSSCQWSSSLPVGGSIELQGPNGLLLPLSASGFIVVPPTPGLFGRGTFVIPASLTVAQFIDLGNRGELRLSYKIGGAEVGSTALSILGKPPTLEAKLNGSNVVPPVTTNATGTATRIFEEFQTLSLSHSVSGAKRFTLHSGEAGVNGEEVYDYLTGISPIPNDFQYTTSSYVVNEFSNPQKYYVTVSSDAYPNGEIRGQFAVFPSNEFSDTLSGQKVVPAVTSQLSGNALLRYDSILEALYVNITSTSTSTTAVLLRGPADSSSTGPILATLCSFKCNLRRIFFGVLKKDSQGFASGQTLASVVEVLLQGKAYVELQTTQNPSGELRANLVPSINNNPPGIPTQEFTFSGRPDIDLVPVPPTPVPSIPTFFRRRRRAQ